MQTFWNFNANLFAISSNYHCLQDVYAVVDGLGIYLKQSGNAFMQEMFYN